MIATRADTTAVTSVDLLEAARRSEDLREVPNDELERDVRDYERFLLLVQKHWDEHLAPTKAIDRVWHLHMLHPRAYLADCIRLFGDVLDHDGGFGSTAAEAPVLAATFARTSALWLAEFGELYVGSSVACTRNCVSRCQRRCKTIVSASAV